MADEPTAICGLCYDETLFEDGGPRCLDPTTCYIRELKDMASCAIRRITELLEGNPHMPKVNAREWREKKLADPLVIEMDNGEEFTVLPPELWGDEAAALASSGNPDPVAMATVMLGGPDIYKRFVDAGGSASMAAAMFGEHFGNLGESSASSS